MTTAHPNNAPGVRDYYSADSWAERTQDLLDRERIALKLLSADLRPSASVLDVGCGTGIFLDRLRKLEPGADLHGVDFSHYQVEHSVNPSLKLRQANLAEGIPHDGESFDVVYAAEIIEHLHDPDFFLAEIHRVLKPGGVLVLSTPNLCAWYNRVLFAFGIQPLFVESSTRSTLIGSGPLRRYKKGSTPVGHVRVLNYDAVVDLIQEAGFSIERIEGALFDYLPKPARVLDGLVRVRPQLASNFVVKAKKTGAPVSRVP